MLLLQLLIVQADYSICNLINKYWHIYLSNWRIKFKHIPFYIFDNNNNNNIILNRKFSYKIGHDSRDS